MNIANSAAVCLTNIGKRLNHEDNYCFDTHYLASEIQKRIHEGKSICHVSNNNNHIQYFAISDGMGGHNAGEVASRICVEKLAALNTKIQSCQSLGETVYLLQTAIIEINSIVCEMGRINTEYKGMGATLVIFVKYNNSYAVLNIGDSRAYYFNGSSLVQITKDNTEGQRMLDLGLLTRKELLNFPARKNLNRYIGYGQHGFILQADEYYPVLEDGVILLCSDGVTDALSDEQISTILRQEKDLFLAGQQLIDRAVVTKNADNATAILIPTRR